jgi:hypothetical protein
MRVMRLTGMTRSANRQRHAADGEKKARRFHSACLAEQDGLLGPANSNPPR